MPNKSRFLMTVYDLVLQWQGKEDYIFTSDERGLTNRAFQHLGFPTFQSRVLRLYSRCAAHLFIYCQLHDTC